MIPRRIRLLVADDSATARAALITLLREEPAIEVVGEAQDGIAALELAKRLRPDVITMDVNMPRLDGLEATAAIMASAPARILIVCAVTEASQQDLSFRAMEAGALELIAKPVAATLPELRVWGRKVAESVRLMAEVPVVTRRRLANTAQQPIAEPPWPKPISPTTSVDAFAIVASTGGPPALAQILGNLPAELSVPILVAQHMAAGFSSGLVRWLASVTSLKVTTAKSHTPPVPGYVYLPPDGHDLRVNEERLLVTSPSTGGHCPSGDRLLFSIAKAYGSRGGAIVLTGMGDDGAEGLLALRKAGGATFAQDEASCTIFGMPRAAQSRGAAERMLPLHTVADTIRQLCERRG